MSSNGLTVQSDSAPFSTKPGDIIGGKYRVERVIGEGGMGFVVAATHMHLEERVAIKLLLPDAAKSADTVERFLREAKAAVKIKSEHVARVSDVGTLENGAPFMVMEYLAGNDLAELIERTGPQPCELSVDLILQACEALAEAHAAGIIHRDLKPANLFLTRRADGSPCIKLLDFGISKFTDGNHSKTKTAAVMGSPAYMSPEQMRSSKDVDARTDIWALGAILFELLTAVPPFDAETVPQLCMKIMNDPMPSLAPYRPDAPPGLEAVIRRCQEKNPSARFAHVGELAIALAPFASPRGRFSVERISEIARSHNLATRNSSPSVPVPPTQVSGGAGFAHAATVAGGPNLAAASGITNPHAISSHTGGTSINWRGSVEPAPAKPAKKSTAPVIAAALIGALVFFAVIGVFMFRGKNGNNHGAEQEAQATEARAGETQGPATGTKGGPVEPATDLPADPTPSAEPAAATEKPATTAAAKTPANTTVTTSNTAKTAATAEKPQPTAKPSSKPGSIGSGLFNDRK